MNDWNPKANEIFLTALECDSCEELQAYLAEVCGSDKELRAQVETLLEADSKAASFLSRPIAGERPTEVLNALTDAECSRAAAELSPEQIALDFLQPSEQPGSLGRLGQYEICEVVGQGGMGIVLKANDTKLNRMVAIKVLAPGLAFNATARKRFLREAQAAAAVSHDHVVSIYAVENHDVTKSSDLPYLVMELIDGQSLQQKIDTQGHLELREILRIGRQVAAGLSAAHLQGLIHRDVKPSNILLQNGVQRVQISDFGLARAVDDVGITRTGEVAGTPQYMSPEQAQGQKVDPRSDLFSLGSVMYAMCTGRSPFRADSTVAALRRVCDDVPRAIREINPDIPVWLVEIIDRLLEKNPDDRFQSAEEVSEVLAKCLSRLQEVGPTSMSGIVIPYKKQSSRTLASRPSQSRGKWLVPAMILLPLGLMLSVTEATGVTHLSGTVIHIMTGEGTLIVEVDDPTVEVSLDGEELSITGAGLQELKLRPGQYQFRASKDGQAIEQKLVSISRGGREVIKVTREAPETVTSVDTSVPAPGALIVIRSDGKQFSRFDNLADAVLGSSEGDTIEIRSNGPFDTHTVIAGHRLRIRAGDSYRPIIRWSPKTSETEGDLLVARNDLVVEGLELQIKSSIEPHPNDAPWPAAIRASGMLRVANCRFITKQANAIESSGSTCEVRNSEFLCSTYGFSVLMTSLNTAKDLIVQNCLLTESPAVNVGRSSKSTVKLSRSTIQTPMGAVWVFLTKSEENSDAGNRTNLVHVTASDNVFGAGPAFAFLPQGVSTNDELSLLRKTVRWDGSGNVFPTATPLIGLEVTLQGVQGTEDLAAWREFWGTVEDGSIVGRVRYSGGEILTRVNARPEQLSPSDFRLRPDSAGFGAGPEGQDLGAIIDLVGPGEAYEKWKQSPGYQDWLKEIQTAMTGT